MSAIFVNPTILILLRELILFRIKKIDDQIKTYRDAVDYLEKVALDSKNEKQLKLMGTLEKHFFTDGVTTLLFQYKITTLNNITELLKPEFEFSNYRHFASFWEDKKFVKQHATWRLKSEEDIKEYTSIVSWAQHEAEIFLKKKKETLTPETNLVTIKERNAEKIKKEKLQTITHEIKGAFINQVFWNKYKLSEKEKIDQLKYFYINPAFSNGGIIQKVIINNFYIKPQDVKLHKLVPSKQEDVFKNLESLFEHFKSRRKFTCYIKITGLGGSGKTTYLWYIAKQQCENCKTIFLDTLDPHSLQLIQSKCHKEDTLLILTDSIYEKNRDENVLFDFFRILATFNKVFFVVSERNNWLDYFERFFKIDNYFEQIYQVPFDSIVSRDKAFHEIIRFLKLLYPGFNINSSSSAQLKKNFLNKSLSLVESKYLLFKQLKAKNLITNNFCFEWEDWQKFTDSPKGKKFSALKYLYHFIGVFQQYGRKINVYFDFNKIFNTDNIDYYFLINEAISFFSSETSPILLDEESNFTLRHDKLGELLINHLNEQEKNIIKQLIARLFNCIDSAEKISLFLSIQDDYSIRQSIFFKDHLTLDKRCSVLENYLIKIPANKYTINEYPLLGALGQTYLDKFMTDPPNRKSTKNKLLKVISKLNEVEKGMKYGYKGYDLKSLLQLRTRPGYLRYWDDTYGSTTLMK